MERESTPPNPASSEVDLLRSATRRYVHDRFFTTDCSREREIHKKWQPSLSINVVGLCSRTKRGHHSCSAGPLAMANKIAHKQKKNAHQLAHTHAQYYFNYQFPLMYMHAHTHTHKTVHSTMVNVVFVCVLVCFFSRPFVHNRGATFATYCNIWRCVRACARD